MLGIASLVLLWPRGEYSPVSGVTALCPSGYVADSQALGLRAAVTKFRFILLE